MLRTNFADPSSSVGHIEARSTQHHEEVKTVDTDARVVFDTKIDMLLDAETKVSRIGEVVFSQLVFFHLKSNQWLLTTIDIIS